MDQHDGLMTTAEVAALLRTPENTVRYWRSVNVGPKSFRLPRRVVYWRRDVLAWLGRQEATDQHRAS